MRPRVCVIIGMCAFVRVRACVCLRVCVRLYGIGSF